MNSLPLPEILDLHEDSQQSLPLATAGVQRYVWEGRFGAMLIEVLDGVIYVDGHRVDRIRDMPRTNVTAQTTGDHP